MNIIKGGVCAAKGFLANGMHCGIKPNNKKDLALIYSTAPCIASATFTSNKVQAAHIKVSSAHIKNGIAQAIIVNSGNANCCTGKIGIARAEKITDIAAKALMLSKNDVLIASTGKIGKQLNIKPIMKNIPALVKGISRDASKKAASAIMTTDTRPKEIAVSINIGKKEVVIGAIAKGAGMIFPNMATMLCFIATDANISKQVLDKALKTAVENSFNCISVEGDTSTNDSVFILANGLAGNPRITSNKKYFVKFSSALNFVTQKLAKEIISDGEGVTKFIELEIKGARTISDAKKIAQRVANSPLVKTAVCGNKPNWGRIAAAAGSAGINIMQEKLDIYLQNIRVMKNGAACLYSKILLMALFKNKDINIKIDLKLGQAGYKIWTTDLSEEYVRINKGL